MNVEKNETQTPNGYPQKQGLNDPQFEHDACGLGFVVNIKGRKSHKIITQALTILIGIWTTAAPADARPTPATGRGY
jgi:hypothetical protein